MSGTSLTSIRHLLHTLYVVVPPQSCNVKDRTRVLGTSSSMVEDHLATALHKAAWELRSPQGRRLLREGTS